MMGRNWIEGPTYITAPYREKKPLLQIWETVMSDFCCLFWILREITYQRHTLISKFERKLKDFELKKKEFKCK